MKISIMVEPSYGGGDSTTVGAREFDAVDEFASALAHAGTATVTVIEATLDTAPPDGYLVLFGTRGLESHASLMQRAILINADRANVLKKLEETNALGAVEKQRYFRWRTEREKENGAGLFARKDLLRAFHASALAGPFQSVHYALCGVSGCADLPSLLVAYLEAHSRFAAPRSR